MSTSINDAKDLFAAHALQALIVSLGSKAMGNMSAEPEFRESVCKLAFDIGSRMVQEKISRASDTFE